VFDPDGYSLEFVFKSWQHPSPNRSMILKSLARMSPFASCGHAAAASVRIDQK
jgi:hypothetical protein